MSTIVVACHKKKLHFHRHSKLQNKHIHGYFWQRIDLSSIQQRNGELWMQLCSSTLECDLHRYNFQVTTMISNLQVYYEFFQFVVWILLHV